jgi:two-component system, chemotaxis family, chemotaxis protein CheY
MAKVLVVDDSKIIRMQLKNMLESLEYEVYQAEDGAIAYEQYKEIEPDLVTMDINMPNMNGLQAVQKIIGEFPDANIIMVSSIDDRNMTYECIGAGAVDFINKPIHIDELKEKVEEALEF